MKVLEPGHGRREETPAGCPLILTCVAGCRYSHSYKKTGSSSIMVYNTQYTIYIIHHGGCSKKSRMINASQEKIKIKTGIPVPLNRDDSGKDHGCFVGESDHDLQI